jgi:protein gp37
VDRRAQVDGRSNVGRFVWCTMMVCEERSYEIRTTSYALASYPTRNFVSQVSPLLQQATDIRFASTLLLCVHSFPLHVILIMLVRDAHMKSHIN